MAVHLDGNPGLTQEFVQFTHETLRTRNPDEAINHIASCQSDKGDMDPNAMQETILLKSILAAKRLNECRLEIPTIEKQKFIVERVMSKKWAIPGSEAWKILRANSSQCWICD
jgi:hypothetical protein